MRLMSLTLLSLFITLSAYGQSPSSLNTRCQKPGFSCGECETNLQNDLNSLLSDITGGTIKAGDHWGDVKEANADNPADIRMKPGVTLDDTLGKIVEMFKKNNPDGENKLNWVVIGASESLQGSSVRDGKVNPRVMLKSPNSELMVTFNTDPRDRGYKTIEIMRWNGNKARYEFQELNFSDDGKPAHVDLTGQKCLQCHKSPNPRPNWDTYRAWSGIVPSRDDMLEMHGTTDGQFDMSKGMQPDAKAYLNFLDQVAADKDSGKKSRLSFLEVPFDDKVQLPAYAGKTLTSREKVDIIKKRVSEEGFYRIKHFPDRGEVQNNENMSFNFDNKTARYSGPSQFAFDQMMGQNMCKIATDISKNPKFEKFKYALAHLMTCGGPVPYPDEFKKKSLNHFKTTQYSELRDLSDAEKPAGDISFDQLEELLRKDVDNSHGKANDYKFDRHERFLQNYLTDAEKMTTEEANNQASYYAEQVMTPTQGGFHAIGDEGGVAGVPEDAGSKIARARALLEPFGVNVSHWSMVHGKDNAYNSFSFSDQYELLETQPLFRQLREEAGGCSGLAERAIASLSEPEELIAAAPSPESDMVVAIDSMCKTVDNETSNATTENMQDLFNISSAVMKPAMQESLKTCAGCHGPVVLFPGLEEFVNSPPTDPKIPEEFINFLNSNSPNYNMTYVELIQYKLGVHGNNPYGAIMPPIPFDNNEKYSEENGVDPLNVQNIRRKHLSMYITMIAGSGNGQEHLKKLCNKLNNDTVQKDLNGNGNIGEQSGASEQ